MGTPMADDTRMTESGSGEPAVPDPAGVLDERTLEHRKLVLETGILESKSRLEQEKLTLEIGELQEAPKRARRTMFLSAAAAVLASITTLVVAVAGAYITWQLQGLANRQKEADVYATLLQNLGSANVPARAGAVVGLTHFATEDPDRSRQTITILVTQLTSETDSRVLRILIPALVSIGQPALDETVRAHRDAYQKYEQGVRRFVASNLPPLSEYGEKANGSRGALMRYDAELAYEKLYQHISTGIDTDLLTRSEAATVSIGVHWHGAKLLEPFYRVSAGADEPFGLAGQTFYYFQTGPFDESKETKYEKFLKDAPTYARNLYVTSLVVGRMIDALSGQLNGRDLSTVAVLFADLRGKSLAGADLRGAFLEGDATGADFTGALLQGANLSNMTFASTNLSFTSLDGATMPNTPYGPVGSRDWKHNSYLGNSDFVGANWWDSANMPASRNIYGAYPHIVGIFVEVLNGPEGKATGLSALSDCADDEFSTKPGKPVKPTNHRARATQVSMRFTIIFCPPREQLEEESLIFEDAFPRKENEQKRVDWLKINRKIATVQQ